MKELLKVSQGEDDEADHVFLTLFWRKKGKYKHKALILKKLEIR